MKGNRFRFSKELLVFLMDEEVGEVGEWDDFVDIPFGYTVFIYPMK